MTVKISLVYSAGDTRATYTVDGVPVRITQKRCKVRWANGVTESLKVVERKVNHYDNFLDNGGYPTSTTVYLDAKVTVHGTVLNIPLEQLSLIPD